MRGGLLGLLDTLAPIHNGGETAVFGIVFATAGSTYQKPGALVLLDRSGMRHGAISGGCLEPQLEDSARKVLVESRADAIEFDTRSDEDLIFGSGTGCRGRISLLLLPQTPSAQLTEALATLCGAAEPLELLLITGGDQIGAGYASLDDAFWCWGPDGQSLPRAAVEKAAAMAPTVHLRIEAPPRILLFGSGPETPPLYLFMHRLGWRANIVEHRGRWLGYAHAANARYIIEQPPGEAAAVWRAWHADAAIAMTHNYALDLQHLTHCAQSDLTYVGLLGPAARRDALLKELGEPLTAHLRPRLHSPVGLGLGGSGPEPLALSIVAELQQHFTQRRQQALDRAGLALGAAQK